MPTAESSMPMVPAKKPLNMLPVDRVLMMVRPKMPNQKYSGGPNCSETSARGGAAAANTMLATREPKALATAAATRPCWAMPFWAKGKPSR